MISNQVARGIFDEKLQVLGKISGNVIKTLPLRKAEFIHS